MSFHKIENQIFIWVFILFILTVLICSVFLTNNSTFIISLTVSTILCTIKFLINSYYFNKILNRKRANIVFATMYNVLAMIIFMLCIYLLYLYLGAIDLKAVIGLLTGVAYIPLVLTVRGILQSLYLIRNKI